MKATEFGRYIKKLRKDRKLTIRQLELYSGVSNAYLSQIENGQRGVPSPDILKKLYKPLGVKYEDLMLNAGYIEVAAPVENMANIEPYDTSRMIRLPVIGTIRAGQPIDRIEHIEGYELVEPELLRGREGFVLRVQGDSMIGDRIYSGDRVIAVKQGEVTPNEIAIVAVNGEEATLKRVKREGDLCILTPSNPYMEPMLVSSEKVHILGKVVQVRHDLP